MDTQRAVALLIAVCAAILVMLAGKSCTKEVSSKNSKTNKAPAVQPGFTFSIVENGTQTAPVADQPEQFPTDEQLPPDDQLPPDAQITQDPDSVAPSVEDPDATIDPSAADIPSEPDPNEPTTKKSLLDEFWDSEHPSYLDPYGNGGYGNR